MRRAVRLAVVSGIAIIASCAPSPAHQGPAAAVRYTFEPRDGTVGTITAGAVCGPTLLLADIEGRIHRLDLQSNAALSPLSIDGMQPMAVAADCAHRLLWVITPARPRGLRAVAVDIDSGRTASDYPVDATCFIRSATLMADELIAAGDCLKDATHVEPPPAASYYATRRNGFRLNIKTGETRAGLDAYEDQCIGAGACVGGAIAAYPNALYAALPTASSIGVYSKDGELQRTFSIESPAFKRDGTELPAGTLAEPRVRWSARNSLLYRIFAMNDRILVVHELAELPANWSLSSPARPQFKAWASSYSLEGQPIRLDLALPELPVAFDGEHLFVIDYGPNGRQGAHEQVSVLRINVS